MGGVDEGTELGERKLGGEEKRRKKEESARFVQDRGRAEGDERGSKEGKGDASTYQDHHIWTSIPDLLSESLERSVLQISVESVRSASSEDRDGFSVELSSPLILDEF